MTPPRYTADAMDMEAAEILRGFHYPQQATAMLRQAADTERALEAFRAELRAAMDAHEIGYLLESFDRRFRRTP